MPVAGGDAGEGEDAVRSLQRAEHDAVGSGGPRLDDEQRVARPCVRSPGWAMAQGALNVALAGALAGAEEVEFVDLAGGSADEGGWTVVEVRVGDGTLVAAGQREEDGDAAEGGEMAPAEEGSFMHGPSLTQVGADA